MQQGAGDLDAPALTAAQLARLVASTVGQRDAIELGGDAGFEARARQTVQRAVVAQVLLDR